MTRDRKIELAMAIFFGAVFIYANFFTVRVMLDLGTKVYTYERLSVAYDIGGTAGMEKELEKILSATDAPQSLSIAKEFAQKRGTIADPGAYVRARVTRLLKKLHFLRTGRTVAITVLVCGFIFRLILARKKKKA